jgi:subtilisin family serine protease
MERSMSSRNHRACAIRSVQVCLLLLCSMISLTAGDAAPEEKRPRSAASPVKAAAAGAEELLVMASPQTDADELNESMDAVHGQIVDTIGTGATKVYVVRIEQGKSTEAEQKLARDGNISMVQRNFKLQVQQDAGFFEPALERTPIVNDPFFPSQWHIGAMNAPKAWRVSKGHNVIIGVVDSGVPFQSPELIRKTFKGYDAVRRAEGQLPSGNHGTLVATIAGAVTNNKINGAAVAPEALIYPFKITDQQGFIYESALLRSIALAGERNIRILNVSANAIVPYTLSNRHVHPIFHAYAEEYHNRHNGLLFLSAGNSAARDSSPRSPNIIVVSAINQRYTRAEFSNYGRNIWFTAPGTNIVSTIKSGRTASVSGTSYSTPCVAAVAAITMAANPNLNNRQVEQILIRSARQLSGSNSALFFGYGLPDASRAVQLARGGLFF